MTGVISYLISHVRGKKPPLIALCFEGGDVLSTLSLLSGVFTTLPLMTPRTNVHNFET